MTATAARDITARPSIVSPMATKISESMLPMMQYIGIKRLEARMLESGNMRRIIADVELFDGVPEDMKAFVMLVKDSIASIVAATGIAKIEINADDNEVDMLKDGYERLDAMYKAAKLTSDEAEAENNAAHGGDANNEATNPDAAKSGSGAGTADSAGVEGDAGKCRCGGNDKRCCKE